MNEQAKTPLLKPALIYGLISAFIGILMSVIFYVLDVSMEAWAGIVSIVVSIAVLVYLLRAYRNEYLGGFATYGQLILMALLIGLISSIIMAIYTYLLFSVIDPDLLEKLKILTEERLYNDPRIPEARADIMYERMEKRFTVLRQTRSAFVVGTIVTFILGLIIAAFLKKEKTPEQMAAE